MGVKERLRRLQERPRPSLDEQVAAMRATQEAEKAMKARRRAEAARDADAQLRDMTACYEAKMEIARHTEGYRMEGEGVRILKTAKGYQAIGTRRLLWTHPLEDEVTAGEKRMRLVFANGMVATLAFESAKDHEDALGALADVGVCERKGAAS